jgi:WD repeat-containing protein 7
MVQCISATEILYTHVSQDSRREIRLTVADLDPSQSPTVNFNVIWKASSPETNDKIQLTSILPLDYNRVILGYGAVLYCLSDSFVELFYSDDGRLRQSALSLMAAQPGNPVIMAMISETAVDGFITVLYPVQNERTKERFLIGGVDDGSISFWSLE